MPGHGRPIGDTETTRRRRGDPHRQAARSGGGATVSRGAGVRLNIAIGALALFLAAAPVSGWAQSPRPGDLDQPALLTADEVTYDEELDIATARGNVEISQGLRVLRADTVSYNRRTNVVTASGNVSLREPSGEVLFADYFEVTDQMREGVAQNLRVLLADQARLAAVSGSRSEGNLTAARKAVYSACELCREDPTRAPLWQIKAARVVHDQAARTVTYNDAWLELAGVPVVYTPYLSHPDGSVERASGFLAPGFSRSNVIGTLISVPYFVVLGPTNDVTIEPIYVEKDRPVIAGEYRQRTRTGGFNVSASATNAKQRDGNNNVVEGDDFRGHVKGTGRFDIDDDWRWGFDLERSTDDTYLERYRLFQRFRFLDSTTLTSNAFTEGFRGRNYAAANTYLFQGLRPEDDPGLSPVVLPLLQYNYVGQPDAWGGRLSFDTGALSIYRSEGTRDQRLSGRGGWLLPYVTSDGHVFSFLAMLQGELYNVSKIGSPNDPFRPTEDGVSARLFPQLSFGWSYPMIRRDGPFRTIVEPIASFVAAPEISDQDRYPNEDSRSIEFDDTNLFRLSRFSGLDRVDSGQRINYGLRTHVSRVTGGYLSAFVGQSYRFQQDDTFPAGSGLDDQESNIVGRVRFSPHEWFGATYRFQFDKDDFSAVRSITGVAVGPQALRLSFSHVFFDQSTQTQEPFDIEQITTALSGHLSQRWRFQVRETRSIGEDEGQLLFGASLIYEDECILAGVDFTRRFVGSLDNPPDSTIVLRIILRNLGEVRGNVY